MKHEGVSQEVTAGLNCSAERSHARIERRFYISAALFMILLSVAGFGPSIIDPSRRNARSTQLVLAHSIIASTWLVLFLVQTSLVATRRTAIHQRVGFAGPALAAVMIIVGYFAAINSVRRGYDLSGDLFRALSRSGKPFTPASVLFPLADLLNFGVLVAGGWWYRHRPDIHKRLMLLAMIPLVGEPILHLVGRLSSLWPNLQGRSIAISVPITILFLAANAIYDRVSRRRIHPVSLWVPILLFAWQIVLGSVVYPSALWHKIAAWLIA